MDMNWADLTTFKIVAEELSFTRAAGRLMVSVSAVSQRVRRLERSLGQRLLTRTTTHVELTEAGELARESIASIEEQWSRTQARIQGLEESLPELARPLRTALYRLAPCDLQKPLATIAAPGASELRHYRSVALGLDQLRRGEVDFLWWRTWHRPHTEHGEDLRELHTHEVVTEDAWAYLGGRHPLAGSPGLSLEQLADFAWVAPPEESAAAVPRQLSEVTGQAKEFVHYPESQELAHELLRTSTAVSLGGPSEPLPAGLHRLPLSSAVQIRYMLSWRHHPAVEQLAPVVLDLYRRWYVERTSVCNPHHHRRMVTDPKTYPGLPVTGYYPSAPRAMAHGAAA
ncbi:LysR family transcriptional regulator [Streptomyces sp. NPDC088097]|uniref:LysR family transcriptional regulator n=1 Tax=Streptomyces sp. NPDC088097 TaxID=3365823 RepID=UPI0037F6514F